MPQVDLETLVSVCAGGSCDNKIACETLATASENHQPPHADESQREEVPPDFPPESFWLSKDAEIDWFDRNAFYERKDSTKGGGNNSTNLNPNINTNNTSNSQRFANLKSKASIIGLPKPQKSCFADAKARRVCKPGNTHLFPKRSGSTGKPARSIIEPSSPKVSCIGRVRSKRDRSRRLRQKQRSLRSADSDSSTKKEKPERRHMTGLLASFRAIFRHNNSNTSTSKRGKKSSGDQNDKSLRKSSWRKTKASKKNTHDILDRLPASDRDAPTKSVEPVSLGAMNRFASGRRADILGADVA